MVRVHPRPPANKKTTGPRVASLTTSGASDGSPVVTPAPQGRILAGRPKNHLRNRSMGRGYKKTELLLFSRAETGIACFVGTAIPGQSQAASPSPPPSRTRTRWARNQKGRLRRPFHFTITSLVLEQQHVPLGSIESRWNCPCPSFGDFEVLWLVCQQLQQVGPSCH